MHRDDLAGRLLLALERVIRALLELRMPYADAELEIVHVNGGPGLVERALDGLVLGILVIDAEPAGAPDGGDSTGRLWLTTAPRKLAHWNRRRPVVR